MKIKSIFKSLAGRVEDIFSGTKAQGDLDLIEQLDRSWSGKSRNGPIHYRPGSREGSWRSHPAHGAGRAYLPTERLPAGSRASRGLTRVSSEPCSIHSLADPRPKQDSASSVHDDPAELVLSAPLDIGPSHYPQQAPGTTAPLPVGRETHRGPSWHRRRAAAAAAVAAKKAAQADRAAREAAAEAKRAAAAAAAAPRKPPCLKQGGLSSALSREPSVRHGVAAAGDSGLSDRPSMDVADDVGVGSWGARKVTFRAQRSDSAHDASQHPTRPSTKPSSGEAVDSDALTAALEALTAAGQISTSSGGDYGRGGANPSPGVIVGDTTLAMEWPDAPVGVGLPVHAPRPLQVAAEASSAPPAASEPASSAAAGDLPRRTRSLDDSVATGQEGDEEGELTAEEAAAAAAAGSGSSEWNAKFVRRWRAVKQRARLQALGMRSIWKLNSPASGEHHPPELLTNELPEGMPLSAAALTGASMGDGLAFSAEAEAQRPRAAVPPAAAQPINRDPSLATMLMGEVAEVC